MRPRTPAFRGPLDSPAAVRAALAGGLTPRDVTILAMDRYAASLPSPAAKAALKVGRGDGTDRRWVAEQLAARRDYLANRVVPLLRAAGEDVAVASCLAWLADADRHT